MGWWRWVGERDGLVEVEGIWWRKMDGLVEVGQGGKKDGSVEVEENGWVGGGRGMSRGRKSEVPKLPSLTARLAGTMLRPWVNGWF